MIILGVLECRHLVSVNKLALLLESNLLHSLLYCSKVARKVN